MDSPAKLRLYVQAPLAAGAVIDLGAEQSHYLLNVMRAAAGVPVAVFNGQDGEWLTAMQPAGKRLARLSVERLLRPQAAEPDLWLLFAPVKRARIDFIVEKATELGVSVLQPVWTRHTVMTRVNDERLTAIAIEAAEQCERLTVPQLRPAADLDRLLAGWPAGRRLLLLDEGAARPAGEAAGGAGLARPIAEALAGLAAAPAALLVGPEGGFAKSELDALRSLSFAVPVGLGPRILRADTAVLAALSCYQAWCGDWRQRSSSD